MSENLPEHPVAASLAPDDDEYLLTMERELPHPVEKVWSALTRSADVVHWAPYRPDRDLTAVGPVVLAHNADDPDPHEPESGQVLRVEPPHLLVLGWGATPPPVHGENAMGHGWSELRDEYAALLG